VKLALSDFMECHFSFLVEDYGFRLTQLSEGTVSFETDNVQLTFIYDFRYTHELDAQLSTWNSASNAYEIVGDLRSFEELRRKLHRGETFPFQVSTPHALTHSLAFISSYLRSHCDDLLRGDPVEIAALREYICKRSESYSLNLQLEAMRRSASEAWSDRNFAMVRSIYARHREHLTPVETRKLAYASKKIADPTTDCSR
jgi:hypothetical protein